jgi:hypothetical protein
MLTLLSTIPRCEVRRFSASGETRASLAAASVNRGVVISGSREICKHFHFREYYAWASHTTWYSTVARCNYLESRVEYVPTAYEILG